MNRNWILAIPIALAMTLATLSCTQPETEQAPTSADPEPAPAPAAEPQDPTVVDADHYKVEFENDRVRVVRSNYGAGEESVMHYHPDHVAVVLKDGNWEFELPDGTKQEVQAQAGDQIFVPAGEHLPRNTTDQELDVVVVELKSGSAGAVGEAGPDATVVDAGHYQSEYENDSIRVVRVTYGPGEESVMHYHPDHLAVFLTDHHVEFQFPDGTSEEVHASAGEHVFAEAGQHLPKNSGDEALELVIVELK